MRPLSSLMVEVRLLLKHEERPHRTAVRRAELAYLGIQAVVDGLLVVPGSSASSSWVEDSS